MVHPLREKVRELRRQGLSYKEITERTGVNKSSIHYMTVDIVVPLKVLLAIDERGREKSRKALASMTTEDRRRASQRGGWAAQDKRRRMNTGPAAPSLYLTA